jgi:RimJ/RimL family protein N-acetyltransferase
MQQPTLSTERLTLHPYSLDDAKDLQRLIGDRIVSDTLQYVPYPHTFEMAEEWIGKRQVLFDEGRSVQFVITDKEKGFFIGGIGFDILKEDENAELGYWIGAAY